MSCAVFHCFEVDGDFELAIWRLDENVVTAMLPNKVTVEFEAEWGDSWQCVGIRAWQMHQGQRGLELTAKEVLHTVPLDTVPLDTVPLELSIYSVDFMLVDSGLVRICLGAWTHTQGRWYNTKCSTHGVRELPHGEHAS